MEITYLAKTIKPAIIKAGFELDFYHFPQSSKLSKHPAFKLRSPKGAISNSREW